MKTKDKAEIYKQPVQTHRLPSNGNNNMAANISINEVKEEEKNYPQSAKRK